MIIYYLEKVTWVETDNNKLVSHLWDMSFWWTNLKHIYFLSGAFNLYYITRYTIRLGVNDIETSLFYYSNHWTKSWTDKLTFNQNKTAFYINFKLNTPLSSVIYCFQEISYCLIIHKVAHNNNYFIAFEWNMFLQFK